MNSIAAVARVLVLALIWIGTSASAATTQSDPVSADIAITGARVIDGYGGEPLESMTVLLRGRMIVGLGPTADVEVPAGARVIDARGKTVMPGLTDVHVHFSLGVPAPRRPDETQQALARQLYYGVTSVLQLGGTDGSVASIHRLYQERAAPPTTPHVYGSGGLITLPGTHPVATIYPPEIREAADRLLAATPADEPVDLDGLGLGISLVRNEAAARKAVSTRLDDGMSAVKIMVESGPLAFGDAHPMMSPEMIRAIVNEARPFRRPVYAHVSSSDELQAVLEAEVDGVVHAVIDRPLVSTATADEMARRIFWVVPTLTLLDGAIRFADDPSYMDDPFFRASVSQAEVAALREPQFAKAYRDAWVRQANDPARAPLEAMRQHHADVLANVGMLHARGVLFAVGTDTGNPYVFPGYSVHRELELLVQAGLTPMQAIVAGTLRGAEFLDYQDQFGTVEVGKRADLLILGADPLADIRNTRKIDMVIIDGQPVDREALLKPAVAKAP